MPRRVVCFGASLTAGTVSADYVAMLAARPDLAGYTFSNHGVNGDLAWHGLQRLDALIAEEPEAVTILIGTNDVNATLSERNREHYQAFYHLPVTPTLDGYRENMEAIVKRIQRETPARIALLSLAPLGEDLSHPAARKIELYNETIRAIAQTQSVHYLPLHEHLVAYLHAHASERAALPPPLAYRDGLINIGNALAMHARGLTWNEVSARHGLLLSTDAIHLNETGAGIVAGLIADWLLGAP